MENAFFLLEGKLKLYTRNGIWQARINAGDGAYVWRSLRTPAKATAISAGTKLYYEIQFKVANGLPIHNRTFGSVIDEYIAWREADHKQGIQAGHGNQARFTKTGMLRQVKRISKFWYEYAGSKAVEAIDDGVLKDFIGWRKAYYQDMPVLPRNAKRNPTDKELAFNLTMGKMMLKFAQDRGYRGLKPFPSYSFTPKVKLARPPFTRAEYGTLVRTLRRWINLEKRPEQCYIRKLLRDYVLILANSGMRTGELNNLRVRDIERFTDELGRENVRFTAIGKTGTREVIPLTRTRLYVDRVLRLRGNPKPDEFLFVMQSGSKIINLCDQFDKVLELGGITHSGSGKKFSLYSLRHMYAVLGLKNSMPVWDVAMNMGTSVQMIQQYYGRGATPMTLATKLGGKVFVPKAQLQATPSAESNAQQQTTSIAVAPQLCG